LKNERRKLNENLPSDNCWYNNSTCDRQSNTCPGQWAFSGERVKRHVGTTTA